MKYDVSIGIPTYNRAHLLERAINSALRQEGVKVEVIVSDNHSEDETAVVMEKYTGHADVRYLRNTFNIGPSANYNQCLDKANGRYFMILGDDDWLSSDYCKILVESIKDEDAVFLGQCQTVASDGKLIARSADVPFRMPGMAFFDDLLQGKPNVRRHACFMLAAKTQSIRAVGGFPSTEAGQHCDNMLLVRLLLTRRVFYDPAAVNFYSVYPESYGNSNVAAVAIASLQYLEFWDKHIEVELMRSPHLSALKNLRKNLIYSLSITYIQRVLEYGKGWRRKLRLIAGFPRWGWLLRGFFRLIAAKVSRR